MKPSFSIILRMNFRGINVYNKKHHQYAVNQGHNLPYAMQFFLKKTSLKKRSSIYRETNYKARESEGQRMTINVVRSSK